MSRKRLLILSVLALLVLLASGLFWLSRPQQLATLILDRAGNALGLEISASGIAEYRLRGTPTLVLRGVSARQPGADNALLEVDRMLLTLPWRTLHSMGRDLTLHRVELDGPRLRLSPLQDWLDARPPSDTPLQLPVITDGLHVRAGQVDGDGWTLDSIDIETAHFDPARPLAAHISGKYLDAPTQADFDLDLGLDQAQSLLDGRVTALRIDGQVRSDFDGTALPATLTLSGPLQYTEGVIQIEPMRFGTSARYVAGQTDLPFILGMHGALRIDGNRLALAPTAAILHGTGEDSPIPDLLAHGTLGLQGGDIADTPLQLALDGRLATWPSAWPPLPPPLGQSDSPLPFSLRYAGALNATDPARLRLVRDQTRFDARFRLPEMLDWLDAFDTGTPLPPLDGHLRTPRMEVAGATLHGVEIEFSSGEEE